jgi:hypothetical protein
MNAPKSSSRITLIAPVDDVGGALPPFVITQSDDKSSIFAPSHVQLGTNYFSTDKEQRFPGMPKVERDGTTYQGILYQSASGSITPEIITHAIRTFGARATLRVRRSRWWAPCATLTATTETRRCWTP